MKIFPKRFYFPIVLLILLTVLFFAISRLAFGTHEEEKLATSPIIIETVEVVPARIEPEIPESINENKPKVPVTLKKEERPENISNLKSAQLDVPFFKQAYLRSCEEASLRMVLAFYGIETNDMEIVQRVGYNPRPWDRENNIWDDPNIMFVGSIDDPKRDGYGTFAPALASAARTFGRDSESYLGVSAQFLAEQIYNGYPVIVWGFTSSPVTYLWKTDVGKEISAYRGEHTRVVVGVFGDSSKPVGFLLHDPLSGEKNEYWSSERLMAHMNTLGNLTNQAVVVK